MAGGIELLLVMIIRHDVKNIRFLMVGSSTGRMLYLFGVTNNLTFLMQAV